jgi:nucleotide-binding universal stress UspA family protein
MVSSAATPPPTITTLSGCPALRLRALSSPIQAPLVEDPPRHPRERERPTAYATDVQDTEALDRWATPTRPTRVRGPWAWDCGWRVGSRGGGEATPFGASSLRGRARAAGDGARRRTRLPAVARAPRAHQRRCARCPQGQSLESDASNRRGCKTPPVIVVGIDGSAGSRAALQFAAEEAGLRQTNLKVVSAWHVPAGVYMQPTYVDLDLDTLRQGAREIAEQQVVDVMGAGRAKTVEVVIREGNAAEALLEESREAEMLVVGSRGHGGFAGLLLGSVSQQCTAHASCPVVVVRDNATG